MNAFSKICSENSAIFFDLNAHNWLCKVFVLLLSEQLLLPQIVDSKDISNARNELASISVEGVWNVLAGSSMEQFKIFTAVSESVSLDKSKRTASGR